MDTEGLRRGLAISFRSVVTREWRLFVGMALGLVAYVFWVGATGAALSQLASFADISTSVDPWGTETTGLTVVGLVLWSIVPAIVAVWLVVREITNVRNNIEKYYRIHPMLLLVPPLLLMVCGGIALVVVGPETGPALAVVSVFAVYFQIRTLTYSYRVFSFSVPRVQHVFLFLTALVVLVTLLVEGAIALGREQFMTDALEGFGELLGISSLSELLETTEVGRFSVPTLPGIAIVTPVGLSVAYICLQAIVGLVVRLRGNQVPRSELKTGQRYPEFARPTTSHKSSSTTRSTGDSATTSSGSSTGSKATSGGTKSSSQSAGSDTDASSGTPTDAKTTNTESSDSSSGQTSEDATDEDDTADEEVTHTRVFTPDTEDDQTEIVGDDATDDSCPYCQAELDADADECHNCGASL